VALASTISAVTLVPLGSAKATATPGATEGYFLVFESGGGGDEDTRVFFLPSAWLELFEVTDAYINRGMDPAEVVDNIRKAANAAKLKKLRAYYGDEADIFDPVPGSSYIQPSPPTSGQTYLAMMISPDKIPHT